MVSDASGLVQITHIHVLQAAAEPEFRPLFMHYILPVLSAQCPDVVKLETQSDAEMTAVDLKTERADEKGVIASATAWLLTAAEVAALQGDAKPDTTWSAASIELLSAVAAGALCHQLAEAASLATVRASTTLSAGNDCLRSHFLPEPVNCHYSMIVQTW